MSAYRPPTGLELADRARVLLAGVRERRDMQERAERAATGRWYAQVRAYGCDHRWLAGPLEEHDGPVTIQDERAGVRIVGFVFTDEAHAQWPTMAGVLSFERTLAAHAAYHAAVHVDVRPTVRWRDESDLYDETPAVVR